MDGADAGHRPTVALRAWRRAPSGPLLPEGTLTLQASLGAQEDRRSGRPVMLSQRWDSLFIQRSAVFASWVPQFTHHCNSAQEPTLQVYNSHPVFTRTNRWRPSGVILCLPPLSCPATFSTQKSTAGSVGVLEPAQHRCQASAFPGTDFCYGDVLLGTSNDVWEPD